MANDAEGQEKQRDSIIQNANILSFPLSRLSSSRVIFAKGPLTTVINSSSKADVSSARHA